MKKLIKGVLFLTIIGATVVSCEKDNESFDIIESELNVNNKETITNNKIDGDIQDPGDCSKRAVNMEASERSIDEIDLTAAYAVESQILEGSTKGLEYQSNYYTLSEYAINNGYIVSDFTVHYNASKAGSEAGYVIMNGNSSDEVFTNSRYNDLMAVINFYEGLSNPSNIDIILSDLKADLIENKNKSKQEVLSFVND